jgi:SAM-dependent methyltransferase
MPMEKARIDEDNLMLIQSPHQIDDLNSAFYSRFPYPWRPQTFDFVDQPDLHARLLNQNIGNWGLDAIPDNPRIWVAGCGTNQAIYTALRFPQGQITGSDLSPKSLELCAQTADELKLTNLKLAQESINDVAYSECFDYAICTGVIHHNAEPQSALRQLARAMKPSGVIELMVYNRFHRVESSAFQKAVRLLCVPGGGVPDSDEELRCARQIMAAFPIRNHLYDLLQRLRKRPESAIADVLIQPVEHSYTVESLAQLAAHCGLEMLSPCLNDWDRANGSYHWHIEFGDPELQQMYDELTDLPRWQFTNLMLQERSPMLWFYFRRTDSGRVRRTQRDINDGFLNTIFERVNAGRGCYLLQPGGFYTRSEKIVPFPTTSPRPEVTKVYQSLDGQTPMKEIFAALNLPVDFGSLLRYRAHLATSAFPFMTAIPT